MHLNSFGFVKSVQHFKNLLTVCVINCVYKKLKDFYNFFFFINHSEFKLFTEVVIPKVVVN